MERAARGKRAGTAGQPALQLAGYNAAHSLEYFS